VNTGQLEFQVAKPRIKWGTYFQDLFRPKFGGGFESYSGKEPSVVAVFRSLQEAEEGATVIENDFKTLGVAAWCERYDVPLNFVS
jgi:hypothetical protein